MQPVVQCGGLAEALRRARVAIASTGTVTLECVLFGVPTVALYRTNWTTYQIARRLVTVDYMAMPNILAGCEVFPEFIQDRATPDHLAGAALELWRNKKRRAGVRTALRRLVPELGGPGAATRAAAHIGRPPHPPTA